MDLLYSTGMRVGELVFSRIEDLDLSGGFLRIPSTHTKTRKPRTAVLPPAIRAQLKAYLKQERRRSGPIFRSQKGGSLTVRQVQRLVRQYAGKAGIPFVTPHTLRHTHIVHALMRKVPLNAVQKQVGHKRLATTQIYADLAPEQVKEAYEQNFWP
ncbi:MAG: tyrosine-type recombinase/integrase [Armatimonadetes bacterium]|nr:tyrosine-type recombinase/integrase [Armatimonadota bacterium]